MPTTAKPGDLQSLSPLLSDLSEKLQQGPYKLSAKRIAWFLVKINAETEDGCWCWTACKLRGYGQFNVGNRKIKLAHRVVLESCVPMPNAHELDVCHSCDTPACVNPKHLWWGTAHDNLKDMFKKGRRSYTGEHNPRAKLNPEKVREARALYEDGATFPELADRFNMTAGGIRHAINGTNWAHVA